ncbi:hypothetical protein JTB14_021826 [Gonioctena quinquepunctata]|nr:hypothetical protein JTB14_021826 [Gonioctena quinquepunctata]
MCTMDNGDWSKDISRFQAFSFGSAEKFFISKSWTCRQGSRGYKFFAESYIHDVFAHKTDFIIKAKCYRSQKKSESQHRLHLQFSPSMDAVVEGHCTCEAGSTMSKRCPGEPPRGARIPGSLHAPTQEGVTRQAKQGLSMRACRVLAKELAKRRPRITLSAGPPARAPPCQPR